MRTGLFHVPTVEGAAMQSHSQCEWPGLQNEGTSELGPGSDANRKNIAGLSSPSAWGLLALLLGKFTQQQLDILYLCPIPGQGPAEAVASHGIPSLCTAYCTLPHRALGFEGRVRFLWARTGPQREEGTTSSHRSLCGAELGPQSARSQVNTAPCRSHWSQQTSQQCKLDFQGWRPVPNCRCLLYLPLPREQ